MGFRRGPSASENGLKKIFDLGARTSFTLGARHTNTIFLCGEAALAVTLPAASVLPNGWTVRFIGEDASSGTLTNTTTITGAGTDELIGHTVGGGDNGMRQLSPPSPAAKDNVKLHSIAARGDWVEITKIGSNFLVFGSSRIADGLPLG